MDWLLLTQPGLEPGIKPAPEVHAFDKESNMRPSGVRADVLATEPH